MAFDNTNRGALFKAKSRAKANSPDLTGELNIEGVEYRLSAWTKRNEDNSLKVISISVSPKNQERSSGSRNQSRAPRDGFEDELPPF